jgi:beta-aspartyl-peptidase (threonine type)
MKNAIIAIFLATAATAQPANKIAFVMHGGAGTITRSSMTAEVEKQYRETLEEALRAGQAILVKGGASLDAVEAGIRILEDSPLFNAGKGAVFTHEGKNELDAAIMDGKTLKAGAVAGVTIIKNPISAARAVMEKSPHVMMAGKGAELFATKMGLEIVDPSYFWTERRWKALQRELMKEQQPQPAQPHAELRGDVGPPPSPAAPPRAAAPQQDDTRHGTVGAVALDRAGNLAAGTSTGGTTNKQYGRIGDTPIIGAGTYANNQSVAVSCTGTGEYFIRWTVAHDIAALVQYKGMTVEQAGHEVIWKKLPLPEGDGGCIILDRGGNHAMPFNSEGMYRGWIGEDGVPHVEIYK